MPRREEAIPRPTPRTPYRIIAINSQVRDDWDALRSTRLEILIRCWDHLAAAPTEPIGGRYSRLKGDQAWCEFHGQRLPQWQLEIDRRAPVKVGVGEDFVVVLSVSAGHPKDNE
jgi:hypothetical protein